MDPRTPVLVGAGQFTLRDGEPLEPVALMEQAARAAAADAGVPALLERLQLITVVDAMSQPLGDPGSALAARIGATPERTQRTGALGGNGPQAAVNDAAGSIVADGLDVALIAGAEAMATFTRLMKTGQPAPWPLADGKTVRQLVPDRQGYTQAEHDAGLIAPIFMYPVIEHALRGASGRSREDHLAYVSEIWSRFSEVAAGNEHAWFQQAYTPEELATPSEDNRRVTDPYLKRHNAHIGVDQGAALLLCSAAAAEAAGVPRDRWVFVHAGGQGSDHWFVSERDELHRSPAIRLAGAAAMEHAGREIDHVDLYSCFPSAVQVAAAELGIATDRQLTQTGGLAFAGGPGNNYSTHGIAALAQTLRADPESTGLATALGWYVTKHAIGVYSCQEPSRPYRTFDVQDAVDALPKRAVAENYEGPAIVESYTGSYEKDGSPGMGNVVVRLGDGRRALAKTHAPDVMAELLTGPDPLGREVRVTAPEGIAFA